MYSRTTAPLLVQIVRMCMPHTLACGCLISAVFAVVFYIRYAGPDRASFLWKLFNMEFNTPQRHRWREKFYASKSRFTAPQWPEVWKFMIIKDYQRTNDLKLLQRTAAVSLEFFMYDFSLLVPIFNSSIEVSTLFSMFIEISGYVVVRHKQKTTMVLCELFPDGPQRVQWNSSFFVRLVVSFYCCKH